MKNKYIMTGEKNSPSKMVTSKKVTSEVKSDEK